MTVDELMKYKYYYPERLAELYHYYKDKVEEKAIFCTDSDKAYRKFASENGYELHQIESGSHKKGIYHINHVNAYHSFIKLFVGKFRGVSTKYLQNYLEWCNTAYGVSGEGVKKLNIVKPAVRSSFAKKWEEIGDRPSLPVAA